MIRIAFKEEWYKKIEDAFAEVEDVAEVEDRYYEGVEVMLNENLGMVIDFSQSFIYEGTSGDGYYTPIESIYSSEVTIEKFEAFRMYDGEPVEFTNFDTSRIEKRLSD